MFAQEVSNRLFAAAFSVVISAAFFAYAFVKGSFPMFGPETSARFVSAAFAVVLTVASFAYAIIPASPGMMA